MEFVIQHCYSTRFTPADELSDASQYVQERYGTSSEKLNTPHRIDLIRTRYPGSDQVSIEMAFAGEAERADGLAYHWVRRPLALTPVHALMHNLGDLTIRLAAQSVDDPYPGMSLHDAIQSERNGTLTDEESLGRSLVSAGDLILTRERTRHGGFHTVELNLSARNPLSWLYLALTATQWATLSVCAPGMARCAWEGTLERDIYAQMARNAQ